ncbi:MAG: DUF2169 domain-containing protein, partial [Planctomycetes bacterium]|nr:DUF2169 domain-containing protein [Planctomycetota bacterium]
RPEARAGWSSADPTADEVQDGTGANGLSMPAEGEEKGAEVSGCPEDTDNSSTPVRPETFKTHREARIATAITGSVVVEIMEGSGGGRKAWLRPGQVLTVGSSEKADFAMPHDSRMSRAHFELRHGLAACHIRDLDSTNGVFVNGVRVGEATLGSGDEIAAGHSKFVVRFETSVVESAEEGGPFGKRGSRESMVFAEPIGQETIEDVGVDLTEPQARPGKTVDLSDAAIQYLEIANETPFSVAVMPRENLKGEPRLTVIVKGTFSIASGEAAPVAEQQLPIFEADQHYDDDPQATVRFETDMVPFKPRTDIVVVGQAYAPGGLPATQVDARVRIGRLDRTIRVFGDRKWLFPTSLAGVPKMSSPQPFDSMELRYERAFGGIDSAAAAYCAENLAGVGFIGAKTKASVHEKPLPNLEDPGELIGSWDSRPKPVGFGFYGRGWQPRLQFAGTYDDEYRKKHTSDLPSDFAYDIYNGAHPDFQIAGYLRGNEEVELENLTPDGHIGFRLPAIHPRMTIGRCSVSSSEFDALVDNEEEAGATAVSTWEEELRSVLDTLVFIPDEKAFYMVFRGSCVLKSLDDFDVTRIHVTM